MNTIKCRIKQNEYQDIGKRGVTPAEALLLRAIHDPVAHKFASTVTGTPEAKNFWKCILLPVAEAEAVTVVPDADNPDKVTEHKRTQGEEIARLRLRYPVRSRDNAKVMLVDELFPGLTPSLPETFGEIGLDVAAPAAPRPKPAKGHGPELAVNVPDRERPGEEAPKAKAPKVKAPKAVEAAAAS